MYSGQCRDHRNQISIVNVSLTGCRCEVPHDPRPYDTGIVVGRQAKISVHSCVRPTTAMLSFGTSCNIITKKGGQIHTPPFSYVVGQIHTPPLSYVVEKWAMKKRGAYEKDSASIPTSEAGFPRKCIKVACGDDIDPDQ